MSSGEETPKRVTRSRSAGSPLIQLTTPPKTPRGRDGRISARTAKTPSGSTPKSCSRRKPYSAPPKRLTDKFPAARTPSSRKIPGPVASQLPLSPPSTPRRLTDIFTPVRTPMKEIQSQALRAPLDLTRARESLCLGFPPSGSMIGRENQLAELSKFIATHVTDRLPGSMYISGPPGTGKTASLDLVLDRDGGGALVVKVNCASVATPQGIYRRVADELGVSLHGKGGASKFRDVVEQRLTTGKDMIIIVLDEIDQLEGGGQQVLYSLYEWPALKGSRVVLIGIANALDLTDRLLPRLHSHGFQPSLIHFPPYTRQEIMGIISNRLTRGRAESVIQPTALRFCSYKVAANSGDIRAALDMCRCAVELAEKESDGTSGSTVTIQIMNQVINNTGSKPTSCAPLPLHQKLAACTLLLLSREGKREPTLGQLYDAYSSVCERRKLVGVSDGDFMSMVSMLEVRGMVTKSGKETGRFQKVRLRVDEEELRHALDDQSLLSALLEQRLAQN